MNPSTQALASGFSELLTYSGEPLKLLRADDTEVTGIACLVDRTPEARPNEKGLNFLPDRASVIELFHTAVSPAPQPGETFEDENQISHRIARVHIIDAYKVRCICVSSE